MTITILGDLNLSQVLHTTRFRTVLNLDHTFCPSSTLSSFDQYRSLLPVGTKYMVVGNLAPIFGERPLVGDVSLSEYFSYSENNGSYKEKS